MNISDYFRFLLALVFVLALIISFALLARRAGFGFPRSAVKPANKRRVSVIEVVPVDGRRRLVLVRRDNVEHLILLGATSECVIETGIGKVADTPDFRDMLKSESNLTSTSRPGGKA